MLSEIEVFALIFQALSVLILFSGGIAFGTIIFSAVRNLRDEKGRVDSSKFAKYRKKLKTNRAISKKATPIPKSTPPKSPKATKINSLNLGNDFSFVVHPPCSGNSGNAFDNSSNRDDRGGVDPD